MGEDSNRNQGGLLSIGKAFKRTINAYQEKTVDSLKAISEDSSQPAIAVMSACHVLTACGMDRLAMDARTSAIDYTEGRPQQSIVVAHVDQRTPVQVLEDLMLRATSRIGAPALKAIPCDVVGDDSVVALPARVDEPSEGDDA